MIVSHFIEKYDTFAETNPEKWFQWCRNCVYSILYLLDYLSCRPRSSVNAYGGVVWRVASAWVLDSVASVPPCHKRWCGEIITPIAQYQLRRLGLLYFSFFLIDFQWRVQSTHSVSPYCGINTDVFAIRQRSNLPVSSRIRYTIGTRIRKDGASAADKETCLSQLPNPEFSWVDTCE